MPCSSATARCGTRMAPCFRSTAARTRANWPGRTIPPGLGNAASIMIVPVAASMLRSTNTIVPFFGCTDPSLRTSSKGKGAPADFPPRS